MEQAVVLVPGHMIQMIGSDYLIHHYPDQLDKIKALRNEIINMERFLHERSFIVRQNSTTSVEFTNQGCELLSELIDEAGNAKSGFEQVLEEPHELDEISRSGFIDLLKDKTILKN